MTRSIKAITAFFLSVFVLAACGSDSPTSKGSRIKSIKEVDSIEVRLRWKDEYESLSFINLPFPKLAYAEIPPEYQLHYKQTLTFEHDDFNIADVLLSFTGTDNSTMDRSELTRDSTFYDVFRDYIEGKKYLCEVSAVNNGWAGPAPATIIFRMNNGSSYGSYFFSEPASTAGDYQLCSEDFSSFLLSLQKR